MNNSQPNSLHSQQPLNSEEFLLGILENDDPVQVLLRLPLLTALRYLAAGLKVSAALQERVAQESCELWRNPPFWRMRDVIEGIESIWGNVQAPEFAQILSSHLLPLIPRAEDFDRTVLFAKLLHKLGQKETARAILLRLASQNPHESESATEEITLAAAALSEFEGSGDSKILLLDLVTDFHLNASDRQDALETFGRLSIEDQPNDAMWERVRSIAQNEQLEPDIRCVAASILDSWGDRQLALSVLHSLVNQNLDGENIGNIHVALGAAVLLGQKGEREFAVSTLQKVAGDGKFFVFTNCFAAEALGKLNEREMAVSLLLVAGRHDRPCPCDGKTTCNSGRTNVARALAQFGEVESAVSILRDIVQNTPLNSEQIPVARMSALNMLWEFGPEEEITPELLRVMHEQRVDDDERRQAIQALGKWGQRSEMVVKELLEHARSEEVHELERAAAIEALGAHGQRLPRVIDDLTEFALNNPHQTILKAAHDALWALVGKQTLDAPLHFPTIAI